MPNVVQIVVSYPLDRTAPARAVIGNYFGDSTGDYAATLDGDYLVIRGPAGAPFDMPARALAVFTVTSR